MMLDALEDDEAFRGWLQLGGETTLRSYGVPSAASATPRNPPPRTGGCDAGCAPEIPGLAAGRKFAHGGFFFSHAGVKPGVPLISRRRAICSGSASLFSPARPAFGATVVHGHTPSPRPVFRLKPHRHRYRRLSDRPADLPARHLRRRRGHRQPTLGRCRTRLIIFELGGDIAADGSLRPQVQPRLAVW